MAIDVNLQHVSINFTLKDHIYDVLREGILNVDIYEGVEDLRLDERQLAQQLGVSRTPIREALARLAQDGLVEILPRKGVFIHRKSLDEILDMVVTWAALESMAAHIAARVATAAEIKALRELPAVRSLAACNKIIISDVVRGDQQYRESLHVTVEGNECEHHSEDALPLVVELWLNRKTQKEPDVGKDAAGFQNVEIWQIIRVRPSE